ncbi:MAG: flagellar brake protein [Clostridia bacterium]
MDINNIILGTKLEVTRFDYNGEEKKPVYISQLEEILDDGSVLIGTPIHEGKIIFIPNGSQIKACFFHPTGLFAFEGEVIAREKRHGIFLLNVSISSSIEKIQRREYYRFDCLMPVKLKVVRVGETKVIAEDSPLTDSIIKDISGGGVGLIANESYHLNDVIEMHFSLDGQAVNTLGKVIRSNVFEQDARKFDVGIVFYEMSMKDRDKVIKFIFQRQSKLRQKGLV